MQGVTAGHCTKRMQVHSCAARIRTLCNAKASDLRHSDFGIIVIMIISCSSSSGSSITINKSNTIIR